MHSASSIETTCDNARGAPPARNTPQSRCPLGSGWPLLWLISGSSPFKGELIPHVRGSPPSVTFALAHRCVVGTSVSRIQQKPGEMRRPHQPSVPSPVCMGVTCPLLLSPLRRPVPWVSLVWSCGVCVREGRRGSHAWDLSGGLTCHKGQPLECVGHIPPPLPPSSREHCVPFQLLYNSV